MAVEDKDDHDLPGLESSTPQVHYSELKFGGALTSSLGSLTNTYRLNLIVYGYILHFQGDSKRILLLQSRRKCPKS